MEPENQNQQENLNQMDQNQIQQGEQNLESPEQKVQKQQTPIIQKQEKKNETQIPPKKEKEQQLWKPYDFLFPGGKLAKLIKVNNIYKKNMPISEMLTKFKYTDAYPVVNIIGGLQNNRGKFYAGIARAAFNTDAVLLTNGIAIGIQKFVLRRGVKMIGVAPERQVKFPKINPTFVQKMQLANGHTHLFLVNNPQKDLIWGGQVEFKINIALKLAEGKKKGQPKCKIVCVLMADAPFDVLDEIKLAVQNDFPIIVVPGSPLCDQLIKNSNGQQEVSYSNEQMKDLIEKGHFFYCNSNNSQDIAQLVHLLLTIKPW